jgi:hypothetical protein
MVESNALVTNSFLLDSLFFLLHILVFVDFNAKEWLTGNVSNDLEETQT